LESKANSAPDLLCYEKRAYRQGLCRVAGIDEAGRGPLAGPVVAAAVILPPGLELPGVKDSKMLSAAQREDLLDRILRSAIAVGIGCVSEAEIDRINILKASFLAMLMAVREITPPPDFLLIDGPYTLPVMIAQQGIPRGDQLSLSIAAASIVAKVHRDRIMSEYHRTYPEYGFDQHKGYATKAHLESLRKHGACPIHRASFRGVMLETVDEGLTEGGLTAKKRQAGRTPRRGIP